MSNRPKIKFVTITRMSDNKILTSFGCDIRNAESLEHEARVIFDKLQDLYLKAGEKQKIRTANGAWFITCDTKDIFYSVLADISYPERHAYSLLKELIEELSTRNDYENSDEATIREYIKDFIPKLIEKYNDLDNLDSIITSQHKLDETKDAMIQTINKMVENREIINDLDQKSDNISMLASDFHQNSNHLHHKMKKKNKKLFIYVLITFIVFLLFIYLIAH